MLLANLVLVAAASTTTTAAAEAVPMDSPRWKLEAQEAVVEEHLGRQCLRLRGGWALLEDVEMLDGIIEYDIAIPTKRGFSGASWRIQDQGNMEQFYMRHYQSGNPDANQYTPIFNGLSAWQLYHGPGYGAAVVYEFEAWIPVRIVISGNQAEVYIKDMERPALFADDLKRKPKAGPIALTSANFAAAHFSNFRYRVIKRPELKGTPPEKRPVPDGAVMRWEISSTFDEKLISEQHILTSELVGGLDWDQLSCEPTGLANISRLRSLSQGHNTALARISITSLGESSAELSFGYSDRARVYLNGNLLYQGNNGFRTRDYRYLGTIGLFDSVLLPLRKGENELVLAVSESFGGWGLVAALEAEDGVTLEP